MSVTNMQNEIIACLEALEAGQLIVYPTDTVWGIGCDATNPAAVEKVYDLKKRSDSKALICLVANDAMLERYVAEVPDVAYDLIDFATKPVTIVYDSPKGLAGNLLAEDNSIGIRVASDPFCRKLISRFKKPLVSTSANISGAPTPGSYDEIAQEILSGVDYVVNLEREMERRIPSSVIKLGRDGTVKVIRE